MNALTIGFVIALLITLSLTQAYAQEQTVIKPPAIVFLTNQDAFIPGDTLVVYGKGFANDNLTVRIFDPAGKAIRIETLRTDSDGVYTAQIFTWPEPTRNFVYGRYALELSSSVAPSYGQTKTVSFTDTQSQGSVQPGSILSVKLDSPTAISLGQTFRMFVQVTFDGALVNVSDPNELLSSSHIHSGNMTINLAGKFNRLHEGIYYADVKLDQPGSYIIHAIAFNRGFLAHDSKVVSSGSSIEEIQETVKNLQEELARTSQELADTREAITTDIGRAESAVDELTQASGQINSIIIPVLALIAVVIALQISLFARIRASFK